MPNFRDLALDKATVVVIISRPGAKGVCVGVWGGATSPWACFSRQIDNFSQQNGEVLVKCISLLQNTLVYMHNF